MPPNRDQFKLKPEEHLLSGRNAMMTASKKSFAAVYERRAVWAEYIHKSSSSTVGWTRAVGLTRVDRPSREIGWLR